MCCSDPAAIAVIEGMPGAGKTTLLARLARAGHTVLAEYITHAGAALDIDQHPSHGEESEHLANWLRKSSQLRRLSGTVWVDRDWLTALAWSASTSGLGQRAAWVYDHVVAGRLVLPQRWIVLDLPAAVSLQRRAGRLARGHPWSSAPALELLRSFYRDPSAAVGQAHRSLAGLIAGVPRVTIDARRGPGELARAVERARDQ